jgi:dTDP-4-dehydrorhamnose 3,5-epimerase-like enzyme
VFFMHQVVQGSDRGGHAHRDTDQFAIVVHGSVKITLSDGTSARTVKLDDPSWGVYLPRMTWTRLFEFSEGAVCLVLASTHYDRSRSIRTWQDYLMERGLAAIPETMVGQILPRPQG